MIRAAKVGPEGSLNAICMLHDDITLFTHVFPDADDRELRAQCRSTLLEYEESMRAWDEVRDFGELDSSSTDSEDEGELTGGSGGEGCILLTAGGNSPALTRSEARFSPSSSDSVSRST